MSQVSGLGKIIFTTSTSSKNTVISGNAFERIKERVYKGTATNADILINYKQT